MPFLKPNWLDSVAKTDSNLSKKQYSNSLEMTGLIAIPLKSLQVRALGRASFSVGIGTM